MYTAFARVYDALMDGVDYISWAAHYTYLMQACGIAPGSRVVECACGTGSLTLPLARAGYRMTGVDLSADMLAVAMEKARAAGVAVPFVRQDMQKLAVPRPVDCVLATCDGVNYLDTPEKAGRFFVAAFAALRPGGALIFDVSTPDKLQNTLGSRTWTREDRDVAYIWRNRYDEKNCCVDMALSVFVRGADGRYDRIDEAQRQRAHARRELRQWLENAGFADVRFFGRQRMTPPRTGDDRWHVSACKP